MKRPLPTRSEYSRGQHATVTGAPSSPACSTLDGRMLVIAALTILTSDLDRPESEQSLLHEALRGFCAAR